MKYILFSVLDRVSNTYTLPFSFSNAETAKRQFLAEIPRMDFPLDKELYAIGEFDDETMNLVGYADKQFVAQGFERESEK